MGMKLFGRPLTTVKKDNAVQGGWHEHQCKDCQQVFPCTVAHGAQGHSNTHRCEPCFIKKFD